MAESEFPATCAICGLPVEVPLLQPDVSLGFPCRCGIMIRPLVPHYRDPRRRHTPEEAARRKKHGDAR